MNGLTMQVPFHTRRGTCGEAKPLTQGHALGKGRHGDLNLHLSGFFPSDTNRVTFPCPVLGKDSCRLKMRSTAGSGQSACLSIHQLTHSLSYFLSTYDIAQNKLDPSPAHMKHSVGEHRQLKLVH